LAKARAVLRTAFGEYSMWILLVLMYIIAGIFIPRLFYFENVQNIIVQGTILGILSIAMAFAFLIGEVDLSIVAIMGFAPLLGLFAINAGLPFFVAPLLTVLVGAGVGLMNGVLIEKVGIPSLVQTVATWWILAGVILVLSEGVPKAVLSSEWLWLGNAYVGPIRVLLIFFLLLVIVVWFFIKNTKTGLRLYLTGGNENSARAAGIPTTRIRILAFVLAGVLAAVAGYALSARQGSVSANIEIQLLAPALAAPVISGVSLTGGRCNLINVVGGAFMLQLIVNIIRLAGMGGFYYNLSQGVLIFVAILIEVLRRRIMGIKM
jgi:simple sugar transport system permease protein/ribose transport system permease protein